MVDVPPAYHPLKLRPYLGHPRRLLLQRAVAVNELRGAAARRLQPLGRPVKLAEEVLQGLRRAENVSHLNRVGESGRKSRPSSAMVADHDAAAGHRFGGREPEALGMAEAQEERRLPRIASATCGGDIPSIGCTVQPSSAAELQQVDDLERTRHVLSGHVSRVFSAWGSAARTGRDRSRSDSGRRGFRGTRA